MSFGIIRLEHDGPLMRRDGFIRLPFVAKRRAEIVVRSG